MSAWWQVGARGGPFVEAAEKFLQWRKASPTRDELLGWLKREVDSFAHDTCAPPDSDDAFLEGAGALLAVWLIATHGGKHIAQGTAHRLALGDFGFFDPFDAIDQSLDAESPMDTFDTQTALAMEEAEGTGTYACVVRAFVRALGENIPELEITERFALNLRLSDGTAIDLQRIAEAAQTDRERTQAATKMVSLLSGRPTPMEPFEMVASNLVPRLVGRRFTEQLRDRAALLFLQPLAADVQIALQLEQRGRRRYVRAAEVEHWVTSQHQPLVVAIQQLASRSPTLKPEPRGECIALNAGDGHDAARLVVPALHDFMFDRLGANCLLSIPHRDLLLAGPRTAEHELRSLTAAAFDAAPHAISQSVFKLGAEGLSVVDRRIATNAT